MAEENTHGWDMLALCCDGRLLFSWEEEVFNFKLVAKIGNNIIDWDRTDKIGPNNLFVQCLVFKCFLVILQYFCLNTHTYHHSRGIDLESVGIGERDALLVFRTLCKVGFSAFLHIVVNTSSAFH